MSRLRRFIIQGRPVPGESLGEELVSSARRDPDMALPFMVRAAEAFGDVGVAAIGESHEVPATDGYVVGHTAPRELKRLATQARIVDPITRRFLVSAGISEGCGFWTLAVALALRRPRPLLHPRATMC